MTTTACVDKLTASAHSDRTEREPLAGTAPIVLC
jgi:hypothetical protein